ncbi:MAG: prolipoprotein diacylglyceryl transferase, partial [Bdellovibrionales bacterium]|nr:prolipoprotein diacylglyceryl transferase [Bdellovibrionales bacterium]
MDILPQPYFHAINPFAIQLTESFGIRWYGLAYLAGFLAGYFSIRWMVKHGKSPLPLELVGDFVFSVAMGCLVGGRLGYCFFYRPELFMDFRSAPPFWGVFAVNEGGMASHGGILGIILVCIWFGRRHKLLTWHLLDLTILGATLGIFF